MLCRANVYHRLAHHHRHYRRAGRRQRRAKKIYRHVGLLRNITMPRYGNRAGGGQAAYGAGNLPSSLCNQA